MARTIADLMAETLLAAGVERIYGVAGDSLNGFTDSLRRMKKIGSLENILKLIPGLGGLTSKLGDLKAPEQEMARTEAVINSMTMKERRNPDLINGSRRQRIAAGSGTTVAQVNQVLRQFTQMRQMMQQVMNPKAKGGRPKKKQENPPN